MTDAQGEGPEKIFAWDEKEEIPARMAVRITGAARMETLDKGSIRTVEIRATIEKASGPGWKLTIAGPGFNGKEKFAPTEHATAEKAGDMARKMAEEMAEMVRKEREQIAQNRESRRRRSLRENEEYRITLEEADSFVRSAREQQQGRSENRTEDFKSTEDPGTRDQSAGAPGPTESEGPTESTRPPQGEGEQEWQEPNGTRVNVRDPGELEARLTGKTVVLEIPVTDGDRREIYTVQANVSPEIAVGALMTSMLSSVGITAVQLSYRDRNRVSMRMVDDVRDTGQE